MVLPKAAAITLPKCSRNPPDINQSPAAADTQAGTDAPAHAYTESMWAEAVQDTSPAFAHGRLNASAGKASRVCVLASWLIRAKPNTPQVTEGAALHGTAPVPAGLRKAAAASIMPMVGTQDAVCLD